MMQEDFLDAIHLATQVVVESYVYAKNCGLSESEAMTIASVVTTRLLDIGFNN